MSFSTVVRALPGLGARLNIGEGTGADDREVEGVPRVGLVTQVSSLIKEPLS